MKKILAIFLATSVSLAVQADGHSNSTPGPVETWNFWQIYSLLAFSLVYRRGYCSLNKLAYAVKK